MSRGDEIERQSCHVRVGSARGRTCRSWSCALGMPTHPGRLHEDEEGDLADRRFRGGRQSRGHSPTCISRVCSRWEEADGLHVLVVVSMLMAARAEETALLRVVAAAVHALGPWKLEGIYFRPEVGRTWAR